MKTLKSVERMHLRLLIALAVVLSAGCRGRSAEEPNEVPVAAESQPWFEEVAARRSLDFRHQSGHDKRFLLPETVAGGAALFDMDNDGDLDAYLIQSGGLLVPPGQRPRNQLFRNNGHGQFANVTRNSGADDPGYGMGVTAGDYDNDGDVDLYVTNVGANVLLRNDGDGRFTDTTRRARVAGNDWSASAAFLDYDSDGDLDLFVTNYVVWSAKLDQVCNGPAGRPDYCSPLSLAPACDHLYRNDGDGRFTDVTEQAGLRSEFGSGLGVVVGDFNGDRRPDIYVANDARQNQLWQNNGDRTFTNVALLAGCAMGDNGIPKGGMGVTAEDLDDDGDLDLLVVNLAGETDSLYANQGDHFADRSGATGLARVSSALTRFGMGLVDFDNDGLLDLYTANGRVLQPLKPVSGGDPYREPNSLFRGIAASRFKTFYPAGGTKESLIATSRAAAFGDLDNDGGVDIVVVNRDLEAHLLRNIVPARGHWIRFKVLEKHNRDALGATLRLRTGKRTISRDVRVAYSYCAANDPRVHVGLGSVTTVGDVTVIWPDGERERFQDLNVDQEVTLRQGQGTPLQAR